MLFVCILSKLQGTTQDYSFSTRARTELENKDCASFNGEELFQGRINSSAVLVTNSDES